MYYTFGTTIIDTHTMLRQDMLSSSSHLAELAMQVETQEM